MDFLEVKINCTITENNLTLQIIHIIYIYNVLIIFASHQINVVNVDANVDNEKVHTDVTHLLKVVIENNLQSYEQKYVHY